MAETTGIQIGPQASATTTTTDHQQEGNIPAEPPRAGFKKYYMLYTTSRFHVRLHLDSQDGPVAYYMQSALSLTSPQLLLRQGDSKKAPMVAFAKLQNLSRHALLGRGDIKGQQPEEQLVWEELRREKNILHRSDYKFSTTERGSGGSGGGKRSEFVWRKNRERLFRTVYDCIDENGDVVARMLSGGGFNWKRAGDIEMAQGLSPGLEEFLLISAITIWAYEALVYESLLQGFDKDEKKRQ